VGEGFYGQEDEAVADSRGAPCPSFGSDGALYLSDAASHPLDDDRDAADPHDQDLAVSGAVRGACCLHTIVAVLAKLAY
jgi:hypothetical protein